MGPLLLHPCLTLCLPCCFLVAVYCIQVDPELVDSNFLRPADQTIRQTDVPERLQLLGKSVLEVGACCRFIIGPRECT